MATSDTAAASAAARDRSALSATKSTWHTTLIPFVAGAIGGSVAATILSPLDIVRTRMQSAAFASRGSSPVGIFMSIVRNEGPLALYRGLVPTIVGVGPARALYFGGYAFAKRHMGSEGLGLSGKTLDIAASAGAGIFSNTIMSPWWVIRLRLQLQETPMQPLWHKVSRFWSGSAGTQPLPAHATSQLAANIAATGGAERGYTGVLDCALRMYREEGWKSFYRGLTASYLGVIETAVQFGIYGEFKRAAIEARLPEIRSRYHALGISQTEEDLRREAYTDSLAFTTSAMSKLVASALTYPHEVLRTRMREQRLGHVRYSSILNTFKTILREEGVRGLYGGMSVHLIRTVPNAAILLLVVEKLVGGSL